MVEILCTAFSYKELYKNYQKVVEKLVLRAISRFYGRKSSDTT
jgi:hypothetical protein